MSEKARVAETHQDALGKLILYSRTYINMVLDFL